MRFSLLILALWTAGAVTAAEMGTFDRRTGNWIVRGKHLSCTFFAGHMFPARFTLTDGGELPRSTFSDSLRYPGKTQIYRLDLERWAEGKVLKNTESEFTIELKGKFCRTALPHMEEFPGVTAVYRYHFRRDHGKIVMLCRLIRTPETGEVRVMRTLSLTWRTPDLFDCMKTQPDGKSYLLTAGRYVDRSRKSEFLLTGPHFSAKVRSPRVIAARLPESHLEKSLLNVGFWDVDWKNGNLSIQAEIELQRTGGGK